MLNPNDILYFLHIPKTGGQSLMHIIASYFPKDQVLFMEGRDLDRLPQDLSRYRFIQGHFDYNFYTYLLRKPVYVTLLREPVARTISLYNYIKRTPDHVWHKPLLEYDISLADFVCHPYTYHEVVNPQTYRLASHKHGQNRTPPDAGYLTLAKEHLETFAFFRLTERYEASMQLLTHTFSWPPITEIPVKNANPNPVTSHDISPEALAAIRERTQLDAERYQFAHNLFQQRYQVYTAQQ
jgi:hypothetical protein